MVFYYKYYLEIRNRTVLTITNWIFVTTTCYYYKEILLFLLVNLNGNFLSTNSTQYYFIFTNISELFSVYLDLIFFISNQTTIFFLIYHSVLFISSGLYKSEYKKLIYIFKIFLFSWFAAVFIFNSIILPTSIKFFLGFQQTKSASFFFEAKILEYFDYFINLYYICFSSFQSLALTILILINFNNSIIQIKRFRKLFYLLFLVFATLITPPDTISQILMGGSLIVLYELALTITLITSKVTN